MTVALIHAPRDYVGVSADAKPTAGVTAGSRFFERDTGLQYVYDGSSWGVLGGSTVAVRVEKTRPANTTAYAANDGVAESDSAGTSWAFAVGRTATGSGIVVGAHVATDQATCTARFELDLYDADVAAPVHDNAEATRLYANSGKFLQTITFPACAKKTTGSTQAEAANADVRVPFKCVGASSIYGVLRSLDAFTPASGQKVKVTLFVVQD